MPRMQAVAQDADTHSTLAVYLERLLSMCHSAVETEKELARRIKFGKVVITPALSSGWRLRVMGRDLFFIDGPGTLTNAVNFHCYERPSLAQTMIKAQWSLGPIRLAPVPPFLAALEWMQRLPGVSAVEDPAQKRKALIAEWIQRLATKMNPDSRPDPEDTVKQADFKAECMAAGITKREYERIVWPKAREMAHLPPAKRGPKKQQRGK
jgi:hypothetical protein